MLLAPLAGAALDSRLCGADGGVRGRGPPPESDLHNRTPYETKYKGRQSNIRTLQGVELEYVCVGVGRADYLLAVVRFCGIRVCAPEW